MKTKLKFSFGKRKYNTKKFYFFYRPLSKATMKQERLVFFYWIGPYFLACHKIR